MDTMLNPIMKLKSKLMMMNRMALVAGATAVLAVTAVSGVTATAYVRNAPVLATASDLANSLIGRSTAAVHPSEQNSGSGPIAQAVTPVAPDALPPFPVAAPVQTLDTPPAPFQQAQIVPPQPPESPARSALTPVPALEPTVTPPAETPSAFIPTNGTSRPVVAPHQGQSRSIVYRRAPREICN